MQQANGVIDMGRVTVDVVLSNNRDVQLAESGMLPRDEIRSLRTEGIVDTGANHIVISQTMADQLGLPKYGRSTVRYADNRTAVREIVHQLQIEVAGRIGTFRAIVEPDRDTMLVGVIVMEDLDLIVDCARNTLAPRDPEHFTSVIE